MLARSQIMSCTARGPSPRSSLISLKVSASRYTICLISRRPADALEFLSRKDWHIEDSDQVGVQHVKPTSLETSL
jgi:hypothetical protein